nr:DUF2851 family protein [Marixanthomonas ophiurae]
MFQVTAAKFPYDSFIAIGDALSRAKAIVFKIHFHFRKSTFYEILDVTASEYWNTHYNFGVTSAKRKKKLTKAFIDLLLINTVIPLQFCYANYTKKDISEEIIQLASSIDKEENSIIKKFNALKPSAKTALDSQGLLQLKNEYCDKVKCLQCAVGNAVLSLNKT